MITTTWLYDALQQFADDVRSKMTQLVRGEPEDQLRNPFETLMGAVEAALGTTIVCTGEVPLPGRLGRPDFAVHANQLLAGYVELKAPGTGANARHFRGRNRQQFKRFAAIPNLLYTDGNEWALYRDGTLQGELVRFGGDITVDGGKAVTPHEAQRLELLLRNFLSWQPVIPTDRNGKIDLKGLAALLAPLCRLLRDEVADALADPSSSLVHLARDWRQLLFPDASDEQFADAYAQTVTFALLLGRSEGADPLTVDNAVAKLGIQHSLLSRALQVLTDLKARQEIAAPLDLLLRVIAAVPPVAFVGPQDPWLYFYEDFLAAYDPDLRKDAGAYYTPVEVVHAQVRLIDHLLTQRLGKPLGFADDDVVTLDPAVGTGTYLLGVIEHALGRVEAEQGEGAVPGQATALGRRLYGFELMVGPYAVAELRVSRALQDRGALLPRGGTHIYLADTLESPNAAQQRMPFFLEPIAEQRKRALKVKRDVPVIVCLGNPPYDRHEAAAVGNKARTGGWVRWGADAGGSDAILSTFIASAVAAGHGVHIKNLYNLYVYFWRWALWKVFEQETDGGQGVVSYISAASYLDGDAFSGMREHMRRVCDEIWIIDLGGEGRGTRQDDNVFAIQTPVAIAIAVRNGSNAPDHPATVHYTRIEGTRKEKLATLEVITDFDCLEWQDCPDGWQDPFRPAGKGSYFSWPLLTDLMPWQHSGVELKRTWPIAPDTETLKRRWDGLIGAKDRAEALRETVDRTIHGTYGVGPVFGGGPIPIARLAADTPMVKPQRYAFRFLDRQWVIGDSRLISRPRPDLQRAHGDVQVYLTTLLNHPLGNGPAVAACANIPDCHHFRGSYGGKDVFPLYRTADAAEPNLLPGLLDALCTAFGRAVTPEDVFAYIYGLLAQPAFTARYYAELESRELRVPITKDAALFEAVRQVGARLLWLHTYGERYVPAGETPGGIPPGAARCTRAVSGAADDYPESFAYHEATQTLRVGDGAFAPVAPAVFAFEVSGLRVVQSWLRYRMRSGAGKKSSPLDDIRPERWTNTFTTELLELLWVLEATVAGYEDQARLLEAVVAGECFRADAFPPVPDEMRKPPKDRGFVGTLFDT
ncbi:MAG TPA: N-6 DNA methylase [Chloroflexi bacterium]|nr:N-6 DNA methylase [Chloroflexota bacterium]